MSNRWNTLSELAWRHKLNQDTTNMELMENDTIVLSAFGDEITNTIYD